MELITLVKRATQGDATAFDHLVTQHWRFVYTICLSQVGHAALAEDLTQEVFIRVSRDLAELREPAKFLAWLRQVARNVCRMWRRRQHATPEPLDAMAEPEDLVAKAWFRQSERAEIVRMLLAQLVTQEPRGAGPALSGGVLGGRVGGGVWGVAVDHQESPP